MEVQPDFRELLALFNARKVEYMIVGGYALAFHGAPRFTGDLDILVKPELINARRILEALDEFGFKSAGLAAAVAASFAWPLATVRALATAAALVSPGAAAVLLGMSIAEVGIG